MPRGPAVITRGPADRINPGVIRTQRVLDPLRNAHTKHGLFRPSNRWRREAPVDIRNRPQLLARKLPWLPQYNFARS